MRGRNITRWVLFGAAILTLPLCCISAVITTITVVPIPMFRTHFEVVNRSGETLYLTPVGQVVWRQEREQDILDQYYWLPNMPVWKRADLRLKPGGTRHIVQMADEDYALFGIVVRNEQGDYRQLEIEEQPSMLLAGDSSPPTTYTIHSFNHLSPVEPELRELVTTADRYNLRRWTELGALIGAGLIPVGLFLAGFYLSRQLKAEARNQAEETPPAGE
jgi:hypothetical protein